MMRSRRGSALILVLMMTLAVAGLSIAAIFMSSSAGLLAAYYDKERMYRLAADAALEMVRSQLAKDTSMFVPDTGMRQLRAGIEILDADGVVIRGPKVNVYAAVTGDTSGLGRPFVTLIAAAYDSRGTRHVRRMDLRQDSFSRYALFVDSFPSTLLHGPGTVQGRVHTNSTWRSSSAGNTYRDTVTAVGTITGTGTYDIDSIVGTSRVKFPRDSTFPRLDTLAAAGNLSFAPVSGSGRGSRLEFVAFDADNDGVQEAGEGFAKVFDLASAASVDTTRLRVNVSTSAWVGFSPLEVLTLYRWDSDLVQNQCGAFYYRGGRWSFIPVAVHRSVWARNWIRSNAAFDYPNVTNAEYDSLNTYSYSAAAYALDKTPTARCFPAGSPYLMLTERFTDASGTVTGTAADTLPFGVVTPAGGWPGGAALGYGGSDTTFTIRTRTCIIGIVGTTGRCDAGTLRDLGTWRAFPGTAATGISASVRQAVEVPYLWPYSTTYNANSRRVISSTSGPLFVSGTVSGPVTLRVAGRVGIVDRLVHAHDPNDPTQTACTDRLGIVASADVLVVEGMATRTRRVAEKSGFGASPNQNVTVALGANVGFRIDANILSTGGVVGVENPQNTMGATGEQRVCPETAASSTQSNGGCLILTGGASMRFYGALYNSSTTYSGFRYQGAADRCQATTSRPPFFPSVNRFVLVRTLEVEPSQANTPAKIRTLLMRLKGKSL